MGVNLRDLGALDGPVLIFGGPSSNLHATRALLAEAGARGIAGNHLICTGDTVAYCADPAATVAALRASGCTVIAGNCEKQIAAGAPDCGCGFDPGSTCDRLSAGWFAHADANLGPDERHWMAGLADWAVFTHQGRRCAVVHGGLSDVARFLWPGAPEAGFTQEIALIEAACGPVDMVFAGHCGLAFRQRVGSVEWINAGVIGIPPNDGTPEVRYAVLSGAEVSIERLRYDHVGARDAMRAAGLTYGYDDALTTGCWPSQEVLPPGLRRAASASG